MIELQEYPAASHLLIGRRAVITAAAGTGIGFATAKRFAEEGASIVVSDRHERRLSEAADRLRSIATGEGAVHAVACDVTRVEDVERLFAESSELLGELDVVVNNAGLGHTSEVVDTRDEDWLRVLDITLNGTFRCLRAAMPRMARGGSIVNVGSVTAHRAERGQSAYAAAKAGVHALTRCAALEAAEHEVRVNAVVPTLAVHEFIEKVADPEHLDAMRSLQPQQRAAQPWEIANVIVFLASDLSSYLTGECLSASSQKP
ncbi:MAG: SDR family oxidoreductase [Myxococcota bacterium]|nr:SDR family oxidoreductase [Myxococcota bacterium]